MEGLAKKSFSVRQLIIRVSDQLKAGEIMLIEATPEEAEAACKSPPWFSSEKAADSVHQEKSL